VSARAVCTLESRQLTPTTKLATTLRIQSSPNKEKPLFIFTFLLDAEKGAGTEASTSTKQKQNSFLVCGLLHQLIKQRLHFRISQLSSDGCTAGSFRQICLR
jgi:hypothetical protein